MGLPNEVNSALIGAAAAGGYQINQSLRWRGSSSIYLSQSVNSAPTTSTSATLSFWMKAAQQNNGYLLFDCRNGSVDWGLSGGIKYEPGFGWGDATFGSAENATGVVNYWTLNQNTSQPALRDPSAWYHVVIIWDGNNGTSTSRMQVYVNGSQSYFYNYYGSIGSGASCPWTRNGYTLKVGGSSNSQFYMAELYCIDGQGLSPGNFAETDALTGAWVPKKYSGSYGNNGFYCKFDPTAANGVGHDHSGSGNHFTATGFQTSTTSSTDYDCMTDSPTNNYATLNPIFRGLYDMTSSIINGGLTMSRGEWASSLATTPAMAPSTGTYYWECYANSDTYVGIVDATAASTLKDLANPSLTTGTAVFRANGNNAYVDNTTFSSVPTWTGQWAGFTYDSTNYTLRLDCSGGNYTLNLSSYSMAGKPVHILVSAYSSQNHLNFGQKPFNRTQPSGSKVSSTKDLPEPTIKKGSKYFNTVLYTGNGSSTRAITGAGFSPDFVWIKTRSNNDNHNLYDTVRGATKFLMSNSTAAEDTNAATLKSFDSDGFTVGDAALVNWNGWTYVAWCWKEGAVPGLDIVSYNSAVTKPINVSHNLGVKPGFILFFNRITGSSHAIYHQSIGATGAVFINSTGATSTSVDYFNNTEPTSTVFTVYDSTGTNNYGTTNAMLAYCFAEVTGFSKFGRYSGNSSTDGTFVYTGFRPAFVMVKNTQGGSWFMHDTARMPYNPASNELLANSSLAEGSSYPLDILSNGFKWRSASGEVNTGSFYIYIAFAELPFKYANAR